MLSVDILKRIGRVGGGYSIGSAMEETKHGRPVTQL